MRAGQIRVAFVITILVFAASFHVRAQTSQEVTLERKYNGEGYSLCGSCTVPVGISSEAWLAKKDEPGAPVIISGTIFREDGMTPDSGITLFLYQTDAGGYYHRPEEDVFHPKIFGWVRTGKDGRYTIHTIRPAPEIQQTNSPAHIHVHIFGKGMPEHSLHEFWFQGDVHIKAQDVKRYSRLGGFSPVIALTKGSDGIWRGTKNIRVRPAPQWRYEED